MAGAAANAGIAGVRSVLVLFKRLEMHNLQTPFAVSARIRLLA